MTTRPSDDVVGIFPLAGQPCDNTINGLCDIPTTDGKQPLFYSRDCNAPIDPANINGLASELASVIDAAESKYDSGRLDNLATAIIKLIEQKSVGIPAGAIQFFDRKDAPPGWLKLNGAVLNANDYPGLYKAITGLDANGQQFQLPDLRGEFLRGWIDNRVMPGQTGRNLAFWEDSMVGSHGHTGRTTEDGEHSHTFGHGWEDHGGGSTCWRNGNAALVTTNAAGKHSHALNINNTGGIETRPRNVAFLLCIKT